MILDLHYIKKLKVKSKIMIYDRIVKACRFFFKQAAVQIKSADYLL